MTTWRILSGVVLVGVLFMTSCAWLGGSSSEAKTPEEHIRSAIDGLNANQSMKNGASPPQR